MNLKLIINTLERRKRRRSSVSFLLTLNKHRAIKSLLLFFTLSKELFIRLDYRTPSAELYVAVNYFQ